MSAVCVGVGIVLVLAVVREVFHSLFHPSGQGRITMTVFRAVWSLSGRLGPRARSLAGPISMIVVMSGWVGVMLLGCTLIYLPSMPESFIFDPALDPADRNGFVDALYYAWVTQTTLGYGDIAPATDVLRIGVALQATLGFGIFTMVVSWVLSVYPALQRQRAAASLAHGLRRVHEETGLRRVEMHPATLARRLERLADMVHAVRVDFHQYPSTFYFASPAPTLSLAGALPFVVRLARADGDPDEVRLSAAELTAALELFAASIGDEHLGMPDADVTEILRAYLRHHGIEGEAALPSRSPEGA